MNRIIFISDFYYPEFVGGAELNDYSLIKRLEDSGQTQIIKMRSHQITPEYLISNKNASFIVSNFSNLDKDSMDTLQEECDYVIYEHDHKYLKRRNPISYTNFLAPKEDLANLSFYKSAKSVICLTKLAEDVLRANTGLQNTTRIGSSVWLDEDLNFIKSLNKEVKSPKYAIMDSDNPIKRRLDCINYCKKNNIDYDLIRDNDHKKFLEKLSNYSGIVFMTGHLETCCRVVVEAKMLGLKVTTQKKLIGASSEAWYVLNNVDLIEEIRNLSQNSVDVFLESFNIKPKKMCVVSTGCVRPSAERVYQNIVSTIDKIKSYDYDFHILTYDTDDAIELKSMLDRNNIRVKFFTIPFIEEAIGTHHGNGYRMFKKNELLIEKIRNYDKYDLVFRHRLDTSLHDLEICSIVEEDVYYTPLRSWNNPFDLAGYAKPKQFKKVWCTTGTDFNVRENEEILKNQIYKNNIKIKPFNIRLILYQGSEEKHLGIPQWSKRNRVFEYKDKWLSEGSNYEVE
tara:strand:+ start:137 stop:1666 length:1530 start_codon:yes stop_codon:yes gene_type:complete